MLHFIIRNEDYIVRREKFKIKIFAKISTAFHRTTLLLKSLLLNFQKIALLY